MQAMPQLRSDAEENRERVRAAARALFSERGLDVAMRDIARRAEVGPATLYRRFPTKQILIDEVFADELRSCRAIVDDGCRDPDPWRGFSVVIERLTVQNVQNRGFVDAFMSASPAAALFTEHRRTLLRMLAELGERAKKTGALRSDFVIEDLVLILMAGRGLSSTTSAHREASARRFAQLALDGLRAERG
ncbi:TetR/AcrR family transcriptional regulator [soil metagenome]